MKHALILLLLFGNITFSYAQYSREKLTDILTGGSSKTWTAKGVNIERPEKSITFNKNMSAQVQKAAMENVKWSLTSPDNIRWKIIIGNETYELIVSYDKSGTQYIKLTHKAEAGKTTGGYEMTLYPVK